MYSMCRSQTNCGAASLASKTEWLALSTELIQRYMKASISDAYPLLGLVMGLWVVGMWFTNIA